MRRGARLTQDERVEGSFVIVLHVDLLVEENLVFGEKLI